MVIIMLMFFVELGWDLKSKNFQLQGGVTERNVRILKTFTTRFDFPLLFPPLKGRMKSTGKWDPKDA